VRLAADVLTSVGAEPVRAGRFPILDQAVERLAAAASLPTPTLWLIDVDEPNACVAGESPYVAGIAVYRGLLTALTPSELLATLAHEIAHLRFGHVADRTNEALRQRGAVTYTAGGAAKSIGRFLGYAHPVFGLAVYGAGRIAQAKGASDVASSLAVNRAWEADADRYVHHLGLGSHLATALLRIAQIQPRAAYPSWSTSLMFTSRGHDWSDHPPLGWRIEQGLASGKAVGEPCSTCLHMIQPGQRCACGAAAPPLVRCSCNADLNPWDRFCGSCGSRVADSRCRACGQTGGGLAAYCPFCGLARP
jgi:Zn-dependent protease with chaperone function